MTMTGQHDVDALPQLDASLTSLVAPIGVPEFLERYWRREPFHCPGSVRRLAPALRDLGSAEIAGLLWQSQHSAILGPQGSEMGAGRRSMATVLEAYEKRGATLCLQMKSSWALARWTAALMEELGEPPIGVTLVFAVRSGGATNPHLDWNDSFTVQIRGTKRWRVAPNGFMAHPVTNWAIGDPPPLFAHSSPLPTEMPRDAREYVLTPGSVLYVPRGFFHQVTSIDADDSLSLNMGIPPTPWAVVLCGLLSNRLLDDPEFRDALCGAFGSGWGRGKVVERLPEKLSRLSRYVAEIEGDLMDLMNDPARLREFLVKRSLPRY